MEKKKKSIWPYLEIYKGRNLDVFKDGSVIVRSNSINNVDYAFKDLTEAFAYVDKKEKMSSFNNTKHLMPYNTFANMLCIDECTSLAPCVPQVCDPVPCQEGNNPMYVDNDKHIESSKINYLSSRGEQSFYQKMNSLPKVFGFGPYDSPETVQEFIDRIVAGKFTIKDPSKKDCKNFYYRPMEGITWKDPSVKEDQAGYDAATAALTALWQDTKDMIAIGTPADGLAAVKALDAWTPVVSPLSA